LGSFVDRERQRKRKKDRSTHTETERETDRAREINIIGLSYGMMSGACGDGALWRAVAARPLDRTRAMRIVEIGECIETLYIA